ncbi:MAG: HAMP domain-containing protein [Calditrichaeota bacterium]|nr:MAG: HAMP domain-containing protein [Calditrichota bacterium]
MKISAKITLWYGSITLAIMILFSGALYWGMRLVLYEALDDDLAIFANTIQESYNPFLGEFEELLFHLESANRYKELWLVVYNAMGRPVYASPMTQYIPLKIPVPKEAQAGYTLRVNVPKTLPWLHTDEDGRITFRAITRRMAYNGRPIGYIQAALPIQRVQTELDSLLRLIVMANIIGILLIGGSGYFLTRRVLSPIRDITRKAREISETRMDERLPIVHGEDELGRLSQTLNNLLERLQQAFRAQQVFISDITHELKTPLSMMRTHWEAELNNPQLDDDTKKRIITDIEAISRLNRLLKDLSTLSKTEERQNWHITRVSLEQVIRDVMNELRPIYELRKQDVNADLPSDLFVEGDRDKLYQVFFNLLENASAYSGDGSAIYIQGVSEKNRVLVRICDNGPGIPTEDQPHIFERFYRVQKDRSRKSGGSGLGLAIVRRIVEAHKGRIHVFNAPEGGACFEMTFPTPVTSLKSTNEVQI